MVFLIQDALSLRMVGTVSLSTSEPYGTQAIWEDCPSRLVVSKLAVLPECQEQGIGTFALGECEVMARKMGFEKVVLDAVTRHELLLQFYVSRGYTRLRDIEILGVSGKPWLATLFEKAVG